MFINYDFDIDDAAIYYLFDRDPESNVNPDLIKSLIAMLTNSRDNENNSSKIEKKLGSEVKAYINENFLLYWKI